MEPTSFDLTPEQKSFLASLSRRTGTPIAVLIAQALEGLQEHMRSAPVNGEADGRHAHEASVQPTTRRKPIWEQFAEAFNDVPDEELRCLPVDGAAQHDHYIYGTPKRLT